MPHLSFNTPLGSITLHEDDGSLVALDWGRAPGGLPTPLLENAKAQIDAYFAGTRRGFDLPLHPVGTDFQQSVWRLMSAIPFGKTRSYGDLAHDLDSAARAVGGACGKNPLPILIPCHRILGAQGTIGGYTGGSGLDTKRWLLEHEARIAKAAAPS